MKKKLLLLIFFATTVFALNAQLTESFDGATFPPTGWTNTHITATTNDNPAAIWERATAGAYGGDLGAGDLIVDPHSGAGMAIFKSYDYRAGNGANLITGAVNLSAGGPHVVKFWIHRDAQYTNQDSVSIYINTVASKTGASFLGKGIRPIGAPPAVTVTGWYQYSFDIPASFNAATNYFIFSAISAYGNNTFIDDIEVVSAPTCGVPALGNITSYNYTSATATINWTAPTIGTTVGYQWALNTSGTPPASGTAITGTTLNITSIVPNVINYVFVRADCGSGSFGAWVSRSFAALPCATITAPTAGATNVPQNQTFAWNAVTGATDYRVFLGNTPGSEVSIGTLTTTSTPITSLFASTTYSIFVLPAIGTVTSPATCAATSFTTGAEPGTPANNACNGAIVITPANVTGNAIAGTTIGATFSDFADVCANATGTSDDDVWYQFTTVAGTPAGTITITPATTGGISDIVALVYQGTNCNTISATPATCADATGGAAAEVVNITSLLPNTRYYMRVFSYSNTTASTGAFNITVSAGSTLPVRLTSFTARRSTNGNVLSWTTEQELNSSHFTVERSSDGSNFKSIGQVTAAGNSSTPLTYTFTDAQPLKGNNYYRLRTVDKDNTFKLSDTRRLKNEGTTAITIYPNPVRDRLSVEINAEKATDGQLIITDMSGKGVYNRSVKILAGNTIVPIELGKMAAGSYILKIQMKDDMIVQKFNKQ